MARLVVKGGPVTELGSTPCVVGRLQSCGLTLDEPQSSRRHFEIEPRGSRWVVNDLGSRNGTLLNGERVNGQALLWHGDRIRVGETVVRFESAPTPFAPGTTLGGCELRRSVGRSEWGLLYEGRQGSLEREVVVEVVDPDLALDPEFKRSYQERARLSGSFDHPGIRAVFDTSSGEDQLFTVFEAAPGQPLSKLLERDPPARERALDILGGLTTAVAHIHGRGRHHGSLSPASVLVDGEGRTKLIGLGRPERLRAHCPDLALQANYASPEEARGAPADARSDVYSLGLLAHRLLAGGLPYRGRPKEVLGAHASSTPVPLAAELDPTLAEVLASMLSKIPSERPPADALVKRFNELRAGKRRKKQKKKKSAPKGSSVDRRASSGTNATPRKAPGERKPRPKRSAGERVGSASSRFGPPPDPPAVLGLRLLLVAIGYGLMAIAASLAVQVGLRVMGM